MKSLMIALSALVVIAGCGNAAEEAAPETPATPAESAASTSSANPITTEDGTTVVAYTNEKGQILCPVMGSVIESAEQAVGYQDYEGKRYYFCCAGCPDEFKANPEKYAKK